ncbi:hypothetical protein OF83DRAFT_389463 [Amylostereum chailletii]|nr:hypothetical protein OF83DRAFT_389463 [Amylostereum chailletii]
MAISGDTSPAVTLLVSTWVGGPLYGVNIVLLVLSIFMLSRRGFVKSNRVLLFMIILQFLISTGDICTLVVQMIRGFISAPEKDPQFGTLLYVLDQSSPEHVAQEAFYIMNSQVGDWFLTWRVFIVWDKSLVLTLPLIVMNIVVFVSSCIGLRNLALLGPRDLVFVNRVRIWFAIVVVVSLTIQFFGTLLIAWRAWETPTAVQSSKRKKFDPARILFVIVDSGALYSVTSLLVLAFYLSEANVSAILVSIVSQLSATVPMTIVMRECWKASHSQGPLLPRNAIVVDSYDMPQRNRSPLSGRFSPGDDNVQVSVMKSIHADSLVSSRPHLPAVKS